MRKIFIAFALILVSSLLLAQESKITQTVRGVVKDAESQRTIPGVNIVLVGNEEIGTTTDINGEFSLENVPVGRQDIKFSFIGYKPVLKRNLRISSGKEIYLEISMTEMVKELDEVVVKAKNRKDQPINKMASVSARSFNIEETEKYAGALGDPSRMAQNFAGVISAGDQRNDIIIRGNSPTGLLWQLDGVPIPNPNHFGAMGSTGGPVSMLNNNLLSNSDFFTGAFPAQYGNAISGVFDLNMRHGNNQNRQYVFQVGFNGFELGAEGPFSKSGRSTYLLNYRYSTLAALDAIGLNNSGGAVPQYQDLSYNFHFPTKKVGTFSFNGMAGTSDIEFLQDEENDGSYANAAEVNTRNGSDMAVSTLSHLYFFNEKTRLKTYVSGSAKRVRTKVDSVVMNDNDEITDETLFYRERNIEYKAQFGTKLKSKIDSKNYVDFGGRFEGTKVDYLDSALYDIDSVGNERRLKYTTQTDIDGEYLNLLQVYGQWKHKFSDDLTLFSGLHGQYLLFNGSCSVEPRVSAEYQAAPQHSFSAGYGLHSMMHPGITYFSQSYDSAMNKYIETNTDLDFTKSHQAVLAYNYVISENLRLKAETYYQHLFDVPVKGVFSNLNYGAGFNFPRIDSMKNEGIGRNYGLEITLEKFLSDNYYFLVTASLFDSKFKNPDGNWRNTAFNNQYVVNALGGVEFPIKERMALNVNLKTVVAGGNPLLAIDVERTEEYGTVIYDYAKAYEERGPMYFRLDTRISFKINGEKVSQEWALDIQNLTDHKNVFNRSYDLDKNEKIYNYQQGLFPMFLYRLNF